MTFAVEHSTEGRTDRLDRLAGLHHGRGGLSAGVKAASTHLPALTGLRFVLAFWVILHHLTGHGQMLEPAALALPAPVYALLRGGYLAVTTFFVLSGFVLSRSYS